MKKKTHITADSKDKIFYFVINLILGIILLIVLLPMLNIIAASFSAGDKVASGQVYIWPVDFCLDGYNAVFRDKSIVTGYMNTIIYTIFGTLFNLFLTLMAAYPLSRKDMPGVNKLMWIFTFTMLFNGGMIPSYLLVRDLNMINTRLAMIIPGAISVYNLIITKTYFQTTIPRELLEAANIDGCSDFRFFLQIALPLSKAIIAVITLFYAVGHWNSFFNAFLYLNTKNLYPLQIILREILIVNNVDPSMVVDPELQTELANLSNLLKYSLIIVASLPVWCMYPFVQKYFVKGVMLGSLKG